MVFIYFTHHIFYKERHIPNTSFWTTIHLRLRIGQDGNGWKLVSNFSIFDPCWYDFPSQEFFLMHTLMLGLSIRAWVLWKTVQKGCRFKAGNEALSSTTFSISDSVVGGGDKAFKLFRSPSKSGSDAFNFCPKVCFAMSSRLSYKLWSFCVGTGSVARSPDTWLTRCWASCWVAY